MIVTAMALLPTACSNPPAPSPQPEPNPLPQPVDDAAKTRPSNRELADGAPAQTQAEAQSRPQTKPMAEAKRGLVAGPTGNRRGRVALRSKMRKVGAMHGDADTESYAAVDANGYFAPAANALSTFAADVDTASFTNVRRMLLEGNLPPQGAVRVEEFVNACDYDLPSPDPREVFGIDTEIAACPWNENHELVRLTVNTKAIDTDKVPPCNLVFLIDVSGSMSSPNKLPLLQQSLDLLIRQLRPQDHVAIVTYASGVRVPLASARGDEVGKIRAAVQALRTSGGTNGQGGIQAAYEIAKKHQVPGVNRVLLATDGDFNIGIRDPDALENFITEKKDDGTFLTVLGFGTGNLKDDRLERLANKGNGVYTYIDEISTARRVLVEQFGASMMTVAKDVKLQTEWSEAHVKQYRLLGYENRKMAAQDFRNDKKDGGEIGAGHIVTALYEIERDRENADVKEPLVTLRIRYKPPMGDDARELSRPITLPLDVPAKLSSNGLTAATAAGLAMQLRGDKDLGKLNLDFVAAMAEDLDQQRHRDLLAMIRMAREIESKRTADAK